MPATDTPRLRPSSFPQWLKCACYESSPISGPAAESGTRQHEALDALLAHSGEPSDKMYPPDLLERLTKDERENAEWARGEVLALAEAYHVPRTKIHREEMVTVTDGEMNQISRGKIDAGFDRVIIDYKGGQVRDYRAQMLAYAAAWAQAYGLNMVEIYEVYGRFRQVKHYTVTIAEATEAVFAVKARVEDPQKKPEACEYCSWCAKAATCPALLTPASVFYEKVNTDDAAALLKLAAVDVEKATPEQLSLMKQVADVLDSWTSVVHAKVKGELASGADIPGFTEKRSKGASKVSDAVAAFEAAGLPLEAFLPACSVSLPKLGEAIAAADGLKKKDGRPEAERRLGPLVKRGRDRIEVIRAPVAIEEKGA
jgi:uncharacterized protein DUF2800